MAGTSTSRSTAPVLPVTTTTARDTTRPATRASTEVASQNAVAGPVGPRDRGRGAEGSASGVHLGTPCRQNGERWSSWASRARHCGHTSAGRRGISPVRHSDARSFGFTTSGELGHVDGCSWRNHGRTAHGGGRSPGAAARRHRHAAVERVPSPTPSLADMAALAPVIPTAVRDVRAMRADDPPGERTERVADLTPHEQSQRDSNPCRHLERVVS
jgi:hypothetical protein